MVVLGVVVALVGFAGYGAWLYFSTEAAVQETGPGTGTVRPEPEGEPSNTLIVGTDSRKGLTEKEQEDLGAATEDQFGPVTGGRADTLILAHVDPATNEVVMVQFPRDLWVPINGRGEDKINSALLDGHSTLVKTVEDLTGLEINHYAQVNIAGFRDLVNAIGGVDLCLTEPVPFDPATGIEVTVDELPLVHFDGDRAIRFVRSRKNFATGDLERIQNQQRFLAAALDKVISPSVLFNPFQLRSIAGVAKASLRLDRSTTLNGLRGLGNRLRGFDPSLYEAYTAPHKGLPPAGESAILPDRRAMKVMFDAIERNESPAEADGVPNVDPAGIEAGVYNTSPVPGAGEAAAQQLIAATTVGGSSVAVVDIKDKPGHPRKGTIVRYRPGDAAKAKLVAAALPGARLRPAPELGSEVDVAVVFGGAGLETERIIQVTPIPIPEPSEQPSECRR